MKAQKTSKSRSTNEQSTSSIDLTSLSLKELRRLKREIDSMLDPIDPEDLSENDLAVSYDVRLVTKEGVIYTNKGTSKLNAILNPRLMADSPGRFEQEFHNNIFSPVYAAAFDLFDKHNPTDTSMKSLSYLEDDGLPDSVQLLPNVD